MFRIGEFARLTQTSVKTLHHYDEIGLLRPSKVDGATGYRYYAASQMARLARILLLKDLGFSLEQVREILDAGLTQEQIGTLLRLKRSEAEQRVREEQARVVQITRRLEQIEQEERLHAFDVQIKQVPEETAIALRLSLASAEFEEITSAINGAFSQLYATLGQYSVRPAPPSLLYWLEINGPNETGDILVGAPLPASLDAAALRDMETLTLPAATVASIVYHGPLQTIRYALITLCTYIEDNDLQICGPRRDFIWQYNRETGEVVNEIQFAVCSKTVPP